METQNDQLAAPSQIPPVLQLNGEQQAIGLELVHNVSTLLCLLSSQATAFESLRSDFLAEIKASRSGTALSSAPFGSGPAGLAKFQHKASHNQRLEELRNLQVNIFFSAAQFRVINLTFAFLRIVCRKKKRNGLANVPCKRSTSANSGSSS